MVALIVSYFLLAYILAPRAIFRLVSGTFLPLKFERTRTDEITSAFWISVIPLVMAWCVMVAMLGPISPGTLRDYKEVFAASYSEHVFVKDPARFWSSLRGVWLAQREFLALYYVLVLAEAAVFVVLLNRYGNWQGRCCLYDWLVDKVLMDGVNEWHFMLSLFGFPSVPERKVVADMLTQEDHLYQGDVAQYFTGGDGALSGLVLQNPRRFDRRGFLRAKRTDPATEVETYWKEIPGRNLFIPAGKILNLNLRYEPTATEEAQTATKELLGEGLKVEVPTDKRAQQYSQRRVSVLARRVRAFRARGTASMRCPVCSGRNVPAHSLPQILADGSEHWDVFCFDCEKQNGEHRQFHRIPADDRQEPCPDSCPYHARNPS